MGQQQGSAPPTGREEVPIPAGNRLHSGRSGGKPTHPRARLDLAAAGPRRPPLRGRLATRARMQKGPQRGEGTGTGSGSGAPPGAAEFRFGVPSPAPEVNQPRHALAAGIAANGADPPPWAMSGDNDGTRSNPAAAGAATAGRERGRTGGAFASRRDPATAPGRGGARPTRGSGPPPRRGARDQARPGPLPAPRAAAAPRPPAARPRLAGVAGPARAPGSPRPRTAAPGPPLPGAPGPARRRRPRGPAQPPLVAPRPCCRWWRWRGPC